MSVTTFSKIDDKISATTRHQLLAASRDQADFIKCAEMVFENAQRHGDESLKENLLITLTMSAIQSQKLHPAKQHDAAQELIKTLGLDEETRKFMYECLFDQGGLASSSIRIFHRS